MEERKWKLGEDLFLDDNLLDPITFREVCLTVHCNQKTKDTVAVVSEIKNIVKMRLADMYSLLDKNIDKIIELSKEGVPE